MMRVALACAALATISWAGCSDPTYDNGNLRCATGPQACPSGFHCAADNTCWRNGSDPDLAVTADMTLPDGAMPPDLQAPIDLALSPADLVSTDDSGCATVDPRACCGVLVTACGMTVSCTGDCTLGGQLCGASGFANMCGCPTDARTGVWRLVSPDASMKRCYTTEASPGTPPSECIGFTIEGSKPKFFVYAGDPIPGTVPLFRCVSSDQHYVLTYDSGCDGVSGLTLDGQIGYVPQAQVCGTTALHRYDTGGAEGVFYTTDVTEKPAGSTEQMPPFFVWTN
jgi:hypothetical protein